MIASQLRCFLAILAAVLITNSTFAQQNSSARKSYPSSPQLPKIGIAKYDTSQPGKLLFRLPQTVYFTGVLEYEEAGDIRSTNITMQSNGDLITMDLPLSDISFHKLDGEEIPQDEALVTLKRPASVFWGYPPEEFYRSMLKSDIITIKLRPGKKWPTTTEETVKVMR